MNAKRAAERFSILFVCNGNTCRSPMAAAIAGKALGDATVRVESAGLFPVRGEPAHPLAVEAMKEYGIDLSRHRTRSLKEIDVDSFNIIVALSRTVAAQLDVAGAPERLVVWTVPDPFGHSLDSYRGTARRIAELVNALAQRYSDFAAPGSAAG